MATLKQKIVAKELSEIVRNGKGNGKGNKTTLGKILIKAGYSKQASKKPKRVMKSKGVKEETRPLVERLKKIRDYAVAEILRRGSDIKLERYNNLVEGIEKFSKLTELLEGRPTERLDFPGWTPAELKQYADTGIKPERFR